MNNGSTILKGSFVGLALLLASSTGASAAILACDSVTTLAQLETAGTCSHQDKIFTFTNTSYTVAGPNAATIEALSHVLAHHEFTASTTGTTDVHGWSFSLDDGTWTDPFTLNYSISVDPAFPLQRIFLIKDQENSGVTPNGTRITDTETVTNPSGQTQIVVVAGTPTGETAQQAFLPLAISITTNSVYNPTGNPGPSGQLVSYEQQWFETSVSPVPEPGTMMLGGGALILLSIFANKRRRSV